MASTPRCLIGRQAPTREVLLGAVVHMQAETAKIRGQAKAIEDKLCKSSDAGRVGTSHNIHGDDIPINIQGIVESIDTLVALKEQMLGKPRETAQAAS